MSDVITPRNREERRAAARKRRRIAGAALTAGTAAFGASAGFVALTATAAGANTFTVENTADSGAGSLRQAIDDANNNPGADVISFGPGAVGTILLQSGLPVVGDDVDIQGPGASVLTVDGGGQFSLFAFDFTDSTISGLTLTGGQASTQYDSGSGGGIALYGGTLDASAMVITGNHSANDGAGVWCNSGDGEQAALTLTSSVVSGNSADSGGGGLYGWYCDVTVVSSTVSGNQARDFAGGGAVLAQGTGEIRNSTVSGNTALAGGGGGIWLYAEQLTMDNSTVSGNTAAYGGGAIASLYSEVTLNQVTITENQALEGPAPDALATTVGGVEISQGGKIAASSREHSRGAHSAAPGEVIANGSIIAGNSSTDVGTFGTVISDHSLIGTIEGATLTDQGGTILGVDPVLGPLAGNGGPTQTHALEPGSPAIDHGPLPVAVFPGNENDQREAGFARVVNGTADIGAFEVQEPTPAPAALVITPRFTG